MRKRLGLIVIALLIAVACGGSNRTFTVLSDITHNCYEIVYGTAFEVGRSFCN